MSGSFAFPFQRGTTYFNGNDTDLNSAVSLEGNKFHIPFVYPISPGITSGGVHRGETDIVIVRWVPSVVGNLSNTANSAHNNSPRGLLLRYAATANHGFYVDSRASNGATESFAGFIDPFLSREVKYGDLFYVVSGGITYCAVAGTGVTAGSNIEVVSGTPGYVQNQAAGRKIGRALETVAASTLPTGPVRFALCQINKNVLAD